MTIFMRSAFLCAVAFLPLALFAATPQVKNVKAFQQYPWNKVCISYEVEGSIAASTWNGQLPALMITAKLKKSGNYDGVFLAESAYLSGDTGIAPGVHRVVWEYGSQGVTINSENTSFVVEYWDQPYSYAYVVIDLSSGANASKYHVSYSNSYTVAYADRTTRLVLKRVTPGVFKMGGTYSTALTRPYFIGVYEVTQKQYELVMGSNPAHFQNPSSPVELVSYDMIRGSTNGAKWPSSSAVDSNSFIGRLRARTGLNFDLPTEAQWEYACRAGTTTKYYWGDSMDGSYAWYQDNSDNTTHYVGSKKPNAWGLYDMSGNVGEWCLDWNGSISDNMVDPKGSSSGNTRIRRGGSWYNDASALTSGTRGKYGGPSNEASNFGFRLALQP